MPATPIPTAFDDLLAGRPLAHLATVDAAGLPQVNPVWFIREGEHILIGVQEATAKYRNLRRNPAVALSIADPANPSRYLELRGKVIAFEHSADMSFVNRLAQKYMGTDFPPGTEGVSRYRLTIAVSRWTTMHN